MSRFKIVFSALLAATALGTEAQKSLKNDSLRIFADDKPLPVTLATDFRQLLKDKQEGRYQNALFTCKLPDSSLVSEQILIQTRGHFRKNFCALPSLKLNFRSPSSPNLSFLKEVKLVNTCDNKVDYEQLLIKEYLVYKIYNLLTDMSFRVRLLKVTYEDILGKKKPFQQYAILLENIDAMASRNKCKELNIKNLHPENANREQMLLVYLFQYMIGNTDWSVNFNHNVRFIQSKDATNVSPYAVPYDFDFGGLVNADYASAPPNLPIEKVTDRLYRGYVRTAEELESTFKIFNQQKSKIYALINECALLQAANKREMTDYIEGFYKTINNKKEVQRLFIENASKATP